MYSYGLIWLLLPFCLSIRRSKRLLPMVTDFSRFMQKSVITVYAMTKFIRSMFMYRVVPHLVPATYLSFAAI